MKATVEEINTVQRRLKIIVSSETVNQAFNAAYARIQKKAKIHGFRPGKAPLSIIKRVYGSNVSYEVGEKLINDHLFTAIKENGVQPIASPYVEVDKAPLFDTAYEFSAVVDIMPKIELGENHRGLEINCKEFEFDAATLERELKGIARRHAKTSPLEAPESTPAANGHLAVISHKASMEGKDLPEMAVDAVPVGLGQEEVFPELEQAILGMKKGESKDVEISLPADYQDPELAGKAVSLHLTLNDLMQLEVPALDEDFAKDLNFDNFEDFKKSIKEQLAKTTENMNKQELETSLLTAFLARVNFEVPPTMVDQVIDSMIGEIRFKDEKERGKALKDEQIRKSMRPEAKTRARTTMLLWDVIKTENLEVSDEEVKKHIKKFVREEDQEVDKQVESTFSGIGDRIRENLLFEKAVGFLTEHAKITKTREKL